MLLVSIGSFRKISTLFAGPKLACPRLGVSLYTDCIAVRITHYESGLFPFASFSPDYVYVKRYRQLRQRCGYLVQGVDPRSPEPKINVTPSEIDV